MIEEGEEKLEISIVGDAFVDMFSYLEGGMPERGGDARLSLPLNRLAGGSAVNTATHFSALLKDFVEKGTPDVVLHTAVNPDDEYGSVMVQHAKDHGFPLVNCRKPHSIGSTGHCIVIVSDGERSFMTHTGVLDEFEASDLNLDLFAGNSVSQTAVHHSHIHIAGYYNIEGFWDGRLKERLAVIRERRRILPMDTSTTVSLVPQHDATGQWDGQLLDLMPLLDFVIMNELEADNISGQTMNAEDDAEAVGKWATAFAAVSPKTWIIVTRGALGAVGIRDGLILTVQPAVQVNVIDPTGAGDCFCAGFIYGMWSWRRTTGFNPVDNDWPTEAIKHAMVWGCGVATCGILTRGASVPSKKQDIKRFVEQTSNVSS